jgi:DNA-binding MarR family transcriptional regulator
MLRTVDVLRRRMSALIDPAGITIQQYNVLRILRGAGAEGLPTLEITTRMIEQAPGITRLLDRLETKKLVHRERCPTDRRQVTCQILPSGLALLSRLDDVVAGADEQLLSALTETEQRQLVRMLDKVRTKLEAGT